MFNSKFFYGEAKFVLAKLGRTREFPGKDLDLYIKRFHERALFCDVVDGETKVDVYLYGMANESRVFLKNLMFPSFSMLMEATKRKKDSLRRSHDRTSP